MISCERPEELFFGQKWLCNMSPEIPFIVNGKKKKKSGKNKKNAECPFSLVICKEIELQCPVTGTSRLYRDREKKQSN